MSFFKVALGFLAGIGAYSLIPGLLTGIITFTQAPAVWVWLSTLGTPWIINAFAFLFLVITGAGFVFSLALGIQTLVFIVLGALGFVAVNKASK
jgi:hypothetical protein